LLSLCDSLIEVIDAHREGSVVRVSELRVSGIVMLILGIVLLLSTLLRTAATAELELESSAQSLLCDAQSLAHADSFDIEPETMRVIGASPSNCTLLRFESRHDEALSVLKGKHLVMVGDSLM
jgi:hypothetical protein